MHDVSDNITILNQIQQFVDGKKIISQKDVTADDICEQVKALENDAESISAQIIQIAQLLSTLAQQENSFSQENNIFNTDASIVQKLKNLSRFAGSQHVNLNQILNNLMIVLEIFKTDAPLHEFEIHSNNEDVISNISHYPESDIGNVTVISDESAGVARYVDRLRKNQRVGEQDLIKIIEARDAQLNQCK